MLLLTPLLFALDLPRQTEPVSIEQSRSRLVSLPSPTFRPVRVRFSVYPQAILIFCITIIYSVISPLILVFGALYFGIGCESHFERRKQGNGQTVELTIIFLPPFPIRPRLQAKTPLRLLQALRISRSGLAYHLLSLASRSRHVSPLLSLFSSFPSAFLVSSPERSFLLQLPALHGRTLHPRRSVEDLSRHSPSRSHHDLLDLEDFQDVRAVVR